MALTKTRAHELPLKEFVYDITFDSAYATGGEALTPQDLGLTAIVAVETVECPAGYTIRYNRATSKLQAFFPGGDQKVAYVDGQNEGSDNTYTVTGIAVGDHLVEVIEYASKASIATQADRTALFSVTATDEISGDGATNRTNNQLRITYRKPSREVPASTNLSAVTCRLVVKGY